MKTENTPTAGETRQTPREQRAMLFALEQDSTSPMALVNAAQIDALREALVDLRAWVATLPQAQVQSLPDSVVESVEAALAQGGGQ